ncbi:unnamed protein product [Cylicostephanus goldi]|uniref:Mitochondrial carrier protein n=1 Tax=Cylicostephanus goldi TaxID=71465 RepID=A0A3P7P5M5_CYLGO|nr:unnamed protein product [Cylicostephanus goldi]
MLVLVFSVIRMDREAVIHFIGGAVGGTAGTCLTCPLEVVKTRMQSRQGINPVGPSTSQAGGFQFFKDKWFARYTFL